MNEIFCLVLRWNTRDSVSSGIFKHPEEIRQEHSAAQRILKLFVTWLFSRSLVRGWCTSLTSYPTSTNLASPDPFITDTGLRLASSSKNESRPRLARKTPMDCRLHLPPSVPLSGRAGLGRSCPRRRVPCCGVQAPWFTLHQALIILRRESCFQLQSIRWRRIHCRLVLSRNECLLCFTRQRPKLSQSLSL